MKLSQRIIIGIIIGVALVYGFQVGMIVSDNILIIWLIALLIGLAARVIAQFILKKLY
ncbi:hypothetical protein GCM10010954_30060 [Halobacillus andaensis]|uniref:Uncharacterized protein n=1 Tax=Halobacillus andaensis TaxID=1176239 RepID=A0A917EXL1_HALAA|nr:hypothetical protein [Halobacillus andaensis]MBP2005109.1 phage shock protein PspC (stress-responsive transcriptional regulator) [Halobacillus andaensis]GGF28930.1 hypothetical protein GCM10010954_30060 [Halobacillus andaensis]